MEMTRILQHDFLLLTVLFVLSLSLSSTTTTNYWIPYCSAFTVVVHSQQRRHPTSSTISTTTSISSAISTTGIVTEGSLCYYDVTVEYEGKVCHVNVRHGETLLSAFERQDVSKQLALPLSMIPHDCRRGNCMTCTARHKPQQEQSQLKQELSTSTTTERIRKSSSDERDSTIVDNNNNNNNLIQSDDGLTPYMSNNIQKRGYVLTCSSTVVGDGVHLVLGSNDDIWTEMYQSRFEEDQTKVEAWSAMAATIRQSDEQNVPRWSQQTEAVMERTSTTTTPTAESSMESSSGVEEQDES